MKSYSYLDRPELLQLLFHPRQETQPSQTDKSRNIDIGVADSCKLGCKFFISGESSPTIIYFHGNGETVSDYEDIAQYYNQAGINLFVATYRGYGWSGGSPDVTSMMNDCKTVFESVQNMLNEITFSGPLFVMGRSLGSAPAIELCTVYGESIRGLIIDSGFAETRPLLERLGYQIEDDNISEIEGFGNLEKIQKIKLPTLLLHGSLDTIIPIPQAEKLQAFSGARMKKFFVIPGADHNTLIAAGGEHYFTTIRGFIDDITGESSWRKRRKKYRKTDK